MLNVVIIGYGEMFTNLIAASLDAGVNIVGVLRKETIKYPTILRKLKDILNPSSDYNYIKSYNLPEITGITGVNTDKFKKKILSLNPDIILVGSWGEKFTKEIYSIPKIATINAHPSLLPKYRGPNPYFWTIRNQETTTGVTLHLMDEGYDTGAILAQEEVNILPTDTGETLKQRVTIAARKTAYNLLMALQEDIIIPLQQRENRASYYSHPEGLELDFKKSAQENHALIRAIYPWGKSYFYHDITPFAPNPHKVFIEKNDSEFTEYGTITYVDSKTKTISVLCGDGNVLKMEDLNLYKNFDKPFTSNYIARDVKVGDILI